jgi:Holliday junction resolvase RusA-like endonuclease
MSATEVIRFRAAGEPIPQGSKKVWLNRATGKPQLAEDAGIRHASWRREVTATALEAKHLAGLSGPLIGPVTILLTFYIQRRQGDYGTGRNARTIKLSSPPYPTGVPDLDKLVRAVFDSLTDAKLWVDDAQVVALTARKRWVDRFAEESQGVEVVVGLLEIPGLEPVRGPDGSQLVQMPMFHEPAS